MAGHRRAPSKIKPRLFIPLFNQANDRAKFDLTCYLTTYGSLIGGFQNRIKIYLSKIVGKQLSLTIVKLNSKISTTLLLHRFT